MISHTDVNAQLEQTVDENPAPGRQSSVEVSGRGNPMAAENEAPAERYAPRFREPQATVRSTLSLSVLPLQCAATARFTPTP